MQQKQYSVYNALRVLLHQQRPTGCYRRFVILFALPPHSSRQLPCPTCHLIHFGHCSAPLHPVLHSFQYHVVHPLASILVLACGHLLRSRIALAPICTYKPWGLCHTPPFHCVSIATCGCSTVHPSLWHSPAIPSYLLHCLRGEQLSFLSVKCAERLSFFWLNRLFYSF